MVRGGFPDKTRLMTRKGVDNDPRKKDTGGTAEQTQNTPPKKQLSNGWKQTGKFSAND